MQHIMAVLSSLLSHYIFTNPLLSPLPFLTSLSSYALPFRVCVRHMTEREVSYEELLQLDEFTLIQKSAEFDCTSFQHSGII